MGFLASLGPSFIKLAACFFNVRPVMPNPIQESLCGRKQTLPEPRQFLFNAWWDFGEGFIHA